MSRSRPSSVDHTELQDNNNSNDGDGATCANSNDGVNEGSSSSGGGKTTAHFTPEELEGIMQVAEDEDPFGLVVSSLCPSIFGHDIVKVLAWEEVELLY